MDKIVTVTFGSLDFWSSVKLDQILKLQPLWLVLKEGNVSFIPDWKTEKSIDCQRSKNHLSFYGFTLYYLLLFISLYNTETQRKKLTSLENRAGRIINRCDQSRDAFISVHHSGNVVPVNLYVVVLTQAPAKTFSDVSKWSNIKETLETTKIQWKFQLYEPNSLKSLPISWQQKYLTHFQLRSGRRKSFNIFCRKINLFF